MKRIQTILRLQRFHVNAQFGATSLCLYDPVSINLLSFESRLIFNDARTELLEQYGIVFTLLVL